MTLDSLIKELLIEVGESSPHKYMRFLQYGIVGLREFNMDVNGVPKIVSLPVNDNGTVDLPEDYIAFIKLAICGTDGNLHHLGINNKMCPMSPGDCGDLENPNGSGEVGFFWSNDNDHYKNGENLGRYFGVGGGNNANGYYKIDEKNGFIVLQNFTGSTVWLEYLADIERNSNGEYEIHPYISEAIKAFVFWKSVQRNTSKNASEKQVAYLDFKREKDTAHRRIQSFTLEEAKQTIRKTFTPTPKY